MRNRAHSFFVLMYALYKNGLNVQYRQQKATKKRSYKPPLHPTVVLIQIIVRHCVRALAILRYGLGEYTTLSSNA